MMIKSITITCPSCKKKFTSTKVLSFNTFNGPPDFTSECFAPTRKCPGCERVIDIADHTNWVYSEEIFSLKNWFRKFLP